MQQHPLGAGIQPRAGEPGKRDPKITDRGIRTIQHASRPELLDCKFHEASFGRGPRRIDHHIEATFHR